MDKLILFELKKLLKNSIVFISSVVFLILYASMLYSWNFAGGWAVTPTGEALYGQEAAAYNEEITLRYRGPLTDDKIQEILKEFRPSDGEAAAFRMNDVYDPVAKLFAESDGTWNGKMVSEVFPAFSGPPQLGMSSRWESFLSSMSYVFLMAGIVLIIIISPVFSDEYSSGMDSLILTARNGMGPCVKAKFAAALLITVTAVGFLLVSSFLVFCLGKGTAGWDADLQLGAKSLFYGFAKPLKCYEAVILLAGISLLAMVTLTAFVLIFSVVSKSSYTSIILSALFFTAPMLVNPGDGTLKKLVMMLPANSFNLSALLSTGGWMLSGFKFSVLAEAGILMVTASVAAMILCRRVFSRHQVM